jgi:Ca2+-binding RTX toxin-like protein
MKKDSQGRTLAARIRQLFRGSTWRGHRQFLPQVEGLSERITPAVRASFDSRTMVLSVLGDSGNNGIVISASGGYLKVTNHGRPVAIAGQGRLGVPNAGRVDIVVNGMGGNDTIRIANAVNPGIATTLIGANGNDTIKGGRGVDVIRGQDGQDSLDGGLGNDSVDGGEGDDALTASAGRDTVDGGAGNDTIALAGALGTTQVDGGADENTIRFAAGTKGTLQLTANGMADALDFSQFGRSITLNLGTTAVSQLVSSGVDTTPGTTDDLSLERPV